MEKCDFRMKKLIILVILLMCTNAYAGQTINLKGGVADILCEGADTSPIVELSYEYRYENVAVETGLSGMSMIIHDTQEGTPYVGKNMGRLNTLECFLVGKYYYNDLYAGVGVGYLTTYFAENYRIYKAGQQADADDEFTFRVIGGWNITEKWFLEGKYTIADLDIESNVPEGILEAHSILNNWSVMMGRRWKF